MRTQGYFFGHPCDCLVELHYTHFEYTVQGDLVHLSHHAEVKSEVHVSFHKVFVVDVQRLANLIHLVETHERLLSRLDLLDREPLIHVIQNSLRNVNINESLEYLLNQNIVNTLIKIHVIPCSA